MKLVQVNGWTGRLNGPLARFIKNELPDIVCLQEATRPHSASAVFKDQYDFVNEIKQAAGFKHEFYKPAWGVNIGGTVVDIGNTILSKLPLADQKSMHTNNSYYVLEQADQRQPNTRVFQAASIEVNGQKIYVANHQAYLSGEHAQGDEVSEQMMEKVAAELAQLSRPLIFCGDLNVSSDTPTLAALDGLGLINLCEKYEVKSTLSEAHRAPKPDRESVACDYIFVSPEVKVHDFYVADAVVSDHKALVLEFDV